MNNTYFPLIVVALAVICSPNPGFGANENIVQQPMTFSGQDYMPGQIIVKFRPGVNESVIAQINQKCNSKVAHKNRFSDFRVLTFPESISPQAMVNLYAHNPNVEYAELNYIAHADMIPNDPGYALHLQWHLDNMTFGGIGMEEAWNLSTGAGVTIAVLDTGVKLGGPDGVPALGGYDFVNNDSDPTDDNGHGTHVAGTIAQHTNNGVGVAGVAYGCSILPVKVLQSGGTGLYSDVAEGIYYAADHAQVINMSFSGAEASTTLEDALAYAYGKGVTIVCSSGNKRDASDTSSIGYPAAYDAYCIAVGATRYNEEVTWYSKCGSALDLTAPGGDTSVDQNGDGYPDGVLQETYSFLYEPLGWGYWFYQGTSMAAPHVSGVAALVISKGIATSPDAVRIILLSTTEDKGDPGWDTTYGWGIVNAYRALGGGTVPPTPILCSITVTPQEARILTCYTDEETTQQYTATGTYSDNSTRDITSSVTWASSDISIATIINSGLATGIRPGTTLITASFAGIKGTASLTVNEPTTTPSTIIITALNDTIRIGDTQQYMATGIYSDNSTLDITSSVTWTSSNASIATISSSGLATGVSAGTTSITASFDSVEGTAALTVTNPLTSITVSPGTATIFSGGTQQFTAIGTYYDQTTGNITSGVAWESLDPLIATISGLGLATGVGAGTTSITATLDGIQDTASLTVMIPPVTLSSIAINPQTTSIVIGGAQQYTASGTYSDNTTKDITSSVTWESLDPLIATISGSGLATGVGAGTTSITATLDGINSNAVSLTVTVPPPTGGTFSAKLSPMTFTYRKSGTYYFVTASVLVKVVDKETGLGVAGVTVTGQWSGAARNLASGVTDGAGFVELKSNEVKTKKPLKFTLTLKKIYKSGWTYYGRYPSVNGTWALPVSNSFVF